MTSLLDATLGSATKDTRTTKSGGSPLAALPEGSTLRNSIPHVDERGSLFEIFSRAWGVDNLPLEHIYCSTIRPGIVKGWALHKTHEDRYFLMTGELQVVLYDVRPASSTCGQVFKINLSQEHRQLLTIPAFVWHADYNIGNSDALLINMPTAQYDYENPDKYRLPIGTPLIPHDFGHAKGW